MHSSYFLQLSYTSIEVVCWQEVTYGRVSYDVYMWISIIRRSTRGGNFRHTRGDQLVCYNTKIQHHDTSLCVFGYVEITHLYFHKRDRPKF